MPTFKLSNQGHDFQEKVGNAWLNEKESSYCYNYVRRHSFSMNATGGRGDCLVWSFCHLQWCQIIEHEYECYEQWSQFVFKGGLKNQIFTCVPMYLKMTPKV